MSIEAAELKVVMKEEKSVESIIENNDEKSVETSETNEIMIQGVNQAQCKTSGRRRLRTSYRT